MWHNSISFDSYFKWRHLGFVAIFSIEVKFSTCACISWQNSQRAEQPRYTGPGHQVLQYESTVVLRNLSALSRRGPPKQRRRWLARGDRPSKSSSVCRASPQPSRCTGETSAPSNYSLKAPPLHFGRGAKLALGLQWAKALALIQRIELADRRSLKTLRCGPVGCVLLS